MHDADPPPEGRAANLAFGGAPTIRDVARLADVSIGTASKALNAGGRMSLETREKVMRVLQDLRMLGAAAKV